MIFPNLPDKTKVFSFESTSGNYSQIFYENPEEKTLHQKHDISWSDKLLFKKMCNNFSRG